MALRRDAFDVEWSARGVELIRDPLRRRAGGIGVDQRVGDHEVNVELACVVDAAIDQRAHARMRELIAHAALLVFAQSADQTFANGFAQVTGDGLRRLGRKRPQ